MGIYLNRDIKIALMVGDKDHGSFGDIFQAADLHLYPCQLQKGPGPGTDPGFYQGIPGIQIGRAHV